MSNSFASLSQRWVISLSYYRKLLLRGWSIFGCQNPNLLVNFRLSKPKRVYFATCGFLIQEFLLAKQELKLNRKMKQLGRFDVVILDDIGYIQQKREEMEVLFSFFSEKYEQGSVMLSSNLPFSRWEEIFKDPMLAAAAIDRLVHHSIILDMNLPSYRLENARTKNNGGDL